LASALLLGAILVGTWHFGRGPAPSFDAGAAAGAGARSSPGRDRGGALVVVPGARESAGYAWIDREEGRVRLPIERAMELVLEEGLPARPSRDAPGGGGER